jgi:hypothetical protein
MDGAAISSALLSLSGYDRTIQTLDHPGQVTTGSCGPDDDRGRIEIAPEGTGSSLALLAMTCAVFGQKSVNLSMVIIIYICVFDEW